MSEQATDPKSVQSADLIIGSLIASGVTTFAYCSGSRNAPFAYALQAFEEQLDIEVFTFGEERVAGFFALGALQGSAQGRAVAVITTSGTAASELHPALEEAKYLGLPLLAVTADRPYGLRGVGANQTTEQLGLYGPSVVAETEIPALSDPQDPKTRLAVAGRVRRLVARAEGHGGTAGPVHINVSFEEPLAPSNPRNFRELSLPQLPTVTLASGGSVPWDSVVEPDLRTVLVAGDGPGQEAGSAMRKLGEYCSGLGIPIIAEPSSGLCDLPTWLPHGPLVASMLTQQYDRDPEQAIQQVIVVGRPTLSREVATLLSLMGSKETRKIVVSVSEQWQDPSSTATEVVPALALDEQELDAQVASQRREWLQLCRELAANAESVVRENSRGLSHLAAARMIWRHSTDTNLWLAASNVVRSFELGPGAPGLRYVYSNRGLAGIDGTISSALGLAAKKQQSVRVVLGDLSFVYDLPAMAARPGGDVDAQLIVFEDGGGSIFHSLEHAGATNAETYQRYFGIHQHIDMVAAAEAMGWSGRTVTTIEELRSVVIEPIRGRSLVVVPLGFPTEQFRAVRKLSHLP